MASQPFCCPPRGSLLYWKTVFWLFFGWVCWRPWVLRRNRRERSLEARGWRSGGRQINWILQVFGVFFFDSKKKSISLYHASPARLRSHRFCTPPACERAGKSFPGTKGAVRSCDEQEWVCSRTLRRSWVYKQAKKQTLPGIASSFSSSVPSRCVHSQA